MDSKSPGAAGSPRTEVQLNVLANVKPPRSREQRIGEVFQTIRATRLEVAELEAQVSEANCHTAVLFLASDVGCVANQGKRAAAHGPSAIQEALFSMQQHAASSDYFDPYTHVDASRLLLLEAHLADLQEQSTHMDPTQREQNAVLCELVEKLGQRARVLIGGLLRARVPLTMVVGGGDNYGYDCIREIFGHEQRPVIVVNFDPHADVRDPLCPMSTEELPFSSVSALHGQSFARHSGNWVSQAMSEKMVHAYIPVGLDPLRNNAWTMSLLKEQGVHWETFRKSLLCTQTKECLALLVELIKSFNASIPVYLNFDADSVKGVHVSALNPDGLDPQHAYECVRTLVGEFPSRIKIVRLAEIGGCSTSPLRHSSGLFGANFITACITASGIQDSSSGSSSKKQRTCA